MSLCEEQTEDSRGEEDEEVEEEEALAPDASSPQEQPANADVSASPLHHLDEVIYRYWRTKQNTYSLSYSAKTKCFFEFSLLILGIMLELQSQMCCVENNTGHLKTGTLLMQQMDYIKY